MSGPDYKQAIKYAINRLEKELSPEITYHNLWHTRDDVLPACSRIAQHIGISEDDLCLVEIAAAYHDIGFTEQYANHEIVGVRIVAQVLPDFGFEPREIEAVIGMIIATRLPQSPRTLLEEILADADLDALGRDDFFPRSEALRQEWTNFGRKIQQRQWYEGQVAFLKNHSYFTPAARMLRQQSKRRHISILESKLRVMS